jgi:hypothetical protein
LSRHYFLPVEPTPPSWRPNFVPTCEMADQSESTRFRELFESALQEYASETGVTLAQHPFAAQLQSCASVDDITILLQERAQAFTDIRARERMMKAIRTTVSILYPLSKATTLAGTFNLVRRTALVACFTCDHIFPRHHSHLQKQSSLVSVFYLMHVSSFGSYVDMLLTSK